MILWMTKTISSHAMHMLQMERFVLQVKKPPGSDVFGKRMANYPPRLRKKSPPVSFLQDLHAMAASRSLEKSAQITTFNIFANKLSSLKKNLSLGPVVGRKSIA